MNHGSDKEINVTPSNVDEVDWILYYDNFSDQDLRSLNRENNAGAFGDISDPPLVQESFGHDTSNNETIKSYMWGTTPSHMNNQSFPTRIFRPPVTAAGLPSSTSSTGHKIKPTFVNEIWNILNDESNSNIIRWSTDGKSFVIVNREEFEQRILPKYFGHLSFASFLRQLYSYGWHKVQKIEGGISQGSSSYQWQFENEFFIKGRKDLLQHIVRQGANRVRLHGPNESNIGSRTVNSGQMHLSKYEYSDLKSTNISSNMNVRSLLERYHSTEDNDLKYMIIKEELPILDLCENFSEYVLQLLVPVLMEESDAEIVNLVSFQVLPHAVELCLVNGKSGTWFDDIIIYPLIQCMGKERTTVALQALKTVSRRVSEHGIRLGTCGKLIEEFLIKCDDTVLSIETLYYLVLCYFDLRHRIPPLILECVLKMIRRVSFDDISKLLIRESVNRANLDAISTVANTMNLQELEAASEHWWRIAPIVIDLFHSKIIPSLINHETRPPALQILLNFKPFYTIKRLNDSTFLGTDNETLLVQILHNIIQESNSLKKEIPANEDVQDDDSDTDFDLAQAAYLAELPSDEDAEYENDVVGCQRTDLSSQEKSAQNICKNILAQVSPTYENLPPIANSLLKRETEDLSSLSQLQLAFQMLSQAALARSPPNLPWSEICQDLVLPRILYDKTFVQKLKAGNLIQSIDEGATLRASAQTTLQLFLPLVDFKTLCLILEYELRIGIRDADSTVRQLAFQVISSLLATHYSVIIGLQYEWYASLLSEDDESEDVDHNLAAPVLRARLREEYPAT